MSVSLSPELFVCLHLWGMQKLVSQQRLALLWCVEFTKTLGFSSLIPGLLFPVLFHTMTKDWGREVYHLWYHCDTYCCLSMVWTLRGGVKVPCAVMSQATRATCTVAHITLHVCTEWLHENPYSSPGFSHTVELCVGSLPGDVCTGEPRDEPTVINHTAGYMHSTHNKFAKSVLSVHNRHTLDIKHNHMRRVSAVRNPFTQMHTKLYRLGLNEAGDPFLLFLHQYIQNYTVFVLWGKSLGTRLHSKCNSALSPYSTGNHLI